MKQGNAQHPKPIHKLVWVTLFGKRCQVLEVINNDNKHK